MLISQLHYEFKLEANKIDSNDRPDLLPAEIDAYLNKAIWLFVKSRYGSTQPLRGFETDQLRISNLASLHVKSPELQPVITPSSLNNGIYEVKLTTPTLSYNYLALTRARVNMGKDGCTSSNELIKVVETDDRSDIRFIKPSYTWKRINARFGKSSDGSNNQSLYLDTGNDFTISGVYVDYLKYPNTVFLGGYDRTSIGLGSSTTATECDIDSAFHPEIVSLAVQELTKDLRDPQAYQIIKDKTTSEFINN